MNLHKIMSALHCFQISDFVMLPTVPPMPPAFCLLCELVKVRDSALCRRPTALSEGLSAHHLLQNRWGLQTCWESWGAPLAQASGSSSWPLMDAGHLSPSTQLGLSNKASDSAVRAELPGVTAAPAPG